MITNCFIVVCLVSDSEYIYARKAVLISLLINNDKLAQLLKLVAYT